MNIENKKTALDDDAAIYQKRDNSFQKKDLSGMGVKGKAGYFKDYYLKTVVVVALIAAFVIYMVYTIFFRNEETILSVAFLDEASITDTEAFNEKMRVSYGLTDDSELLEIADYDLDDNAMLMKFTALTAAQSVDVMICPRETFEKYSGLGYFEDLSEILPDSLYDEVSGRIVEASEVERDVDGAVVETLPAAPYGIDISGNRLYDDCGGGGDDSILCIVTGAGHMDNAIKFVDYIIHY